MRRTMIFAILALAYAGAADGAASDSLEIGECTKGTMVIDHVIFRAPHQFFFVNDSLYVHGHAITTATISAVADTTPPNTPSWIDRNEPYEVLIRRFTVFQRFVGAVCPILDKDGTVIIDGTVVRCIPSPSVRRRAQ